MSNSKSIKPLAAAIGAAFVTSIAGAQIANAQANPFGVTELSSGYMQMAGNEGKCGGEKKVEKEAKCGGEKKAAAEAKCGAGKGDEMKAEEGKTTEEKMEEGKCGGAGAPAKAMKEGKCGEAKCGANKK
jgi:uncharacterized low-complexity protein